MNVIDRFQLEKSLTDKSAEAEARTRETTEEKKRVEELNQQNKDLKVRKFFMKLYKSWLVCYASLLTKTLPVFCLLVREGRAGSRGRGNSQEES